MLKIEHLRKNYQSFVLDCSLQIPDGRITGLIGPNGAGKSTTFKAILGLIHKDSGSVQLFGKEIEQLSEKEKQQLGVVLSDSGFSGYLTIQDLFPILDELYDSFDACFFAEQLQRLGLPKNKK
ncbi:MAG: ATP-binding cassette domain-containing protein, partial [Erysipelotrichaceae bacterium]|nr:ATP-binding cassette domain-containing protein [Erysipelotrichaceae bacterium]